MSRRPKASAAAKWEAVLRYQRGEASMPRLAAEYGVNKATIGAWLSAALAAGPARLETRATNQRYTADFKRQAVAAYLAGEGSYLTLSIQLGLRSKAQLQQWVAAYNGHRVLRSTGGHQESRQAMTKG